MPSPRLHPLTSRHHSEGGYMLLSACICLLLVIFMLGTFSFVSKRSLRFQANYAVGEQLANLAAMAHAYAQSEHYRLPPAAAPLQLDGALLYSSVAATGLTPPDNFNFSPFSGTSFVVEVRGLNEAPIAPAIFRAASAYIHMRIRQTGGELRSATDDIALMQGAGRRGMTRMGMVQANNGDLCDGAATRVRWGPEASSCLNDAHIGVLGFTNVQPGDVIVPAWETALARTGDQAVYRFPQPERPDMSRMVTGIAMQAQDILNAGVTSAVDMDAAGDVVMQNAVVRHNQPANFQQPVTVNNQALRVHDQNAAPGPVMEVIGDVAFTNANLSVGETLREGAGPLDVTVANPVITRELGNTAHDLAINRKGGAGGLAVAVQTVNPASSINDVTLQSDASVLAVTAALNTEAIGPNASKTAGGQPAADFYGAELVTPGGGTMTITDASGGSIPWDIGSIDQKNTGSLGVTGLQAENCLGKACPDNVTQTPGGGL